MNTNSTIPLKKIICSAILLLALAASNGAIEKGNISNTDNKNHTYKVKGIAATGKAKTTNPDKANGNIEDPIFYQSFDHIDLSSEVGRYAEAKADPYTVRSRYHSVYSRGLSGKALDLTANVGLRIPYVMSPEENPSFKTGSSFAIQVWVKTLKGALQGTPIMSNKPAHMEDSVGWSIGTHENGAWFWNISDGQTTYSYEPTAERQAINDGEWHEIVISVDKKKSEIWMYFDGRNVAIYRLETRKPHERVDSLNDVSTQYLTVIGGSDEYAEPDQNYSRREWTAFNGKIDEVKVWQRPLSTQEVVDGYKKYKTLPENNTMVPDHLKVQSWNIWHGGHRFGENVGLQRVIEVVEKEKPDIIGFVETYGSGAKIADSLGYYFYLISDNLSIMTRFPIKKTIKSFKSFFSGGVILELGGGKEIAVFDNWLWYADNNRRTKEMATILSDIAPYIRNADKVPVIMTGDYNTHSHLDVTADRVASLPVTKEVQDAGFKDSFRELHPDAVHDPGYTWSPLYDEQFMVQKDGSIYNNRLARIDYIFYKGRALSAYKSEKVDHHPVFWPSDHATVITYFNLDFNN